MSGKYAASIGFANRIFMDVFIWALISAFQYPSPQKGRKLQTTIRISGIGTGAARVLEDTLAEVLSLCMQSTSRNQVVKMDGRANETMQALKV
jgi:hypothetical protein